MKSEDRHHLEQNELADWLSKTGSTARPFLPVAAGAIAIVLLVGFGYSFWSQSQRAAQQDAWNDFLNATEAVQNYVPSQTGENAPSVYEFGAERFEEVAAGYPGTEVAARARLRAADYRFEFGKSLLLKDRGKAVTVLDEAIQQYDRLASDQGIPGDVRRQALFAKGLAQESQGALKSATETYEQIVSQFEITFPDLATQAKNRIKILQDERVKEFYANLSEYTPQEPSLDLPSPASEGGSIPLPPKSGDPGGSPLIDFENIAVPAPPKTATKSDEATEEKPKAEANEKAESKEEPAKPAESPEKEAPAKEAKEEPKADSAEKPEAKEAPKQGDAEKPAGDDKKSEPAVEKAAPNEVPKTESPNAAAKDPQAKEKQ